MSTEHSDHATDESVVSNPTSSPDLLTYYAQRGKNVRRQLPEVSRRLKAAGVVQVVAEYDGCGDQGQIDSIHFLGAEGQKVGIDGTLLAELKLDDLFFDLIDSRHWGWVNNEGACGEIRWDLVVDRLHHVHNTRFSDYETTVHEGL